MSMATPGCSAGIAGTEGTAFGAAVCRPSSLRKGRVKAVTSSSSIHAVRGSLRSLPLRTVLNITEPDIRADRADGFLGGAYQSASELVQVDDLANLFGEPVRHDLGIHA